MSHSKTMNLGKPPLGRDHEEKWPYAKFVEKISVLESKVFALEIALRDLEIDCAQYRIALCNSQAAMFKGLTENPFPWNEQEQKAWESGLRASRLAGAKEATKINARKTNKL